MIWLLDEREKMVGGKERGEARAIKNIKEGGKIEKGPQEMEMNGEGVQELREKWDKEENTKRDWEAEAENEEGG